MAAGLAESTKVTRSMVMAGARRALASMRGSDSAARSELLGFVEAYGRENSERYNSHVYSNSPESPLKVPATPAAYSDTSPTLDGRMVLLRNFDANFARDPRIFVVGEDVGRLGDVNLVFEGLQAIGENVIVPVHPRTRLAIEASGVPIASHVRLIDPIGYLDMLKLQSDARVVLTDSGGVQREAYWLGVPCVILRDETEWGEIISTGANVLAGVDPARIVRLTRMAAAPAITPALESHSRPSARIAQLLYEDI